MSRKKKKAFSSPLIIPSVPETRKKVELKPLNKAQSEYMKSIDKYGITIALGSAGTGKTMISALTAVKYYTEGLVSRIIIARPMVNAGDEDIGALPGGINEKLDPYVKPMLDAFGRYWSSRTIKDMLENDKIEVVPFGFMRGRSFSDAFVIVDEAQNITEEGLLMVLTRFGEGCKMVITGDPRQTDLAHKNCLITAYRRLRNVPDVNFVKFHSSDVVRHPVVKDILEAWDSSMMGDDKEYDNLSEVEQLPKFLTAA